MKALQLLAMMIGLLKGQQKVELTQVPIQINSNNEAVFTNLLAKFAEPGNQFQYLTSNDPQNPNKVVLKITDGKGANKYLGTDLGKADAIKAPIYFPNEDDALFFLGFVGVVKGDQVGVVSQPSNVNIIQQTPNFRLISTQNILPQTTKVNYVSAPVEYTYSAPTNVIPVQVNYLPQKLEPTYIVNT